MNQNLINLEMPYAPAAYDDIGFKNVIEDHLSILANDPECVVVQVTPMQLYKFDFDLVKLLRDIGVSPELHWIVMRINNLSSMRDLPKENVVLRIPDLLKVNRLLQTYRSSAKIN